MSRNIDTSDLGALDEDDLRYLHDRDVITTAQLAEALSSDEDEVLAEKKGELSKPRPVEEYANTGDANTAGLSIEELDDKLARMAKDQAPADEDEAEEIEYSAMTNDELRAEIARRNAEEDKNLSIEGRKADLIATLEADDEEE